MFIKPPERDMKYVHINFKLVYIAHIFMIAQIARNSMMPRDMVHVNLQETTIGDEMN